MKRVYLVGGILAAGLIAIGAVAAPRLSARFQPAAPRVVLPVAQPFVTSTVVTLPTSTKTTTPKTPKKTPTSTKPVVSSDALPKEVNLAVPFLSQAPKKNWAMPYQEACEEASLSMIDAYYRGQTSFTPDQGDEAILKMVAWEEAQKPPYPVDLTLGQAGEVAAGFFSEPNFTIQTITSAEEIKRILAGGHPIVVPADGKALKNPNFHNGGPIYHMLVVKGYTADGRWITNDPGTRLGADYLYAEQLLVDAIHDWNGGEVTKGAKIVLILSPGQQKR